MMEKQIWIEKKYKKSFNKQIIMDFDDQIWSIILKVPILVIFCWIDNFFPLTCILKSF